MTENKNFSNRAGSIAGRGFHYQDAVGVWYAVGSWSQKNSWGSIVPEGEDDLELLGDEKAFVQVKSRRDHRGSFLLGDVKTFIEDLWKRHEAATEKPNQLILVLEKDIKLWRDEPNIERKNIPILIDDALGQKLKGDARCEHLLPKTFIVIVPNPLENSVFEIKKKLDCNTLEEAVLHYGNLLQLIGKLADENGDIKDGNFLSVSQSDIDRKINDLRSSIALDNMQAALKQGFCEAIDFLTPIEDSSFYLGVDCLPGHLAAGLVVERPEERKETLDLLDKKKQVLIVGASGSGKSSLMWEVARYVRHRIRWYRIRSISPDNIHLLTILAKEMRAAAHAPIGFIFDDVGRSHAEAWDALSKEAEASFIVMLGSIREEDVFLLTERARIGEVRPQGNEQLAQRIWEELQDQGQTSLQAWREFWKKSEGRLLEYTFILSQGDRMENVLKEQVDQRVREKRDGELSILRVAAAANSVGCGVEIESLSEILVMKDADLSRSLQRLCDEHLLQDSGDGLITGLHQLRSEKLLRLSHETPPPTLIKTIENCSHTIPAEELETFVSKMLERHSDCEEKLISALQERIIKNPDCVAVASILQGLGQAYILKSAREWALEIEQLEIPPSQITAVVMMAWIDSDWSEIHENFASANEAAKILKQKINFIGADDSHSIFMEKLPNEVVDLLFEFKGDPSKLTKLLTALVASPLSSRIRNKLFDLKPALLSYSYPMTIDLLQAAISLDRDIGKKWVSVFSNDDLLEYIKNNAPWTTHLEIRDDEKGKAACGDICYVAATIQEDVHEEVVQLCEDLLAIFPDTDLAISRAVDLNGSVLMINEDIAYVEKKIPRKNLPFRAETQWKRRWMATVGREVAVSTITEYLVKGFEGLELLIPALERILDQILRGKINEQARSKVNEVHELSQSVTPPLGFKSPVSKDKTEKDENISITDLQSILFDCSAGVVRRFMPSNQEHPTYVAWLGGILECLEKARLEPWDLIDKDPEPLFDRLEKLLKNIQIIAAEAGERDKSPVTLWLKLAKTSRLNNAINLVAANTKKQMNKRVLELKNSIDTVLTEENMKGYIHIIFDEKNPLPWPSDKVIIVCDIIELDNWFSRANEIFTILKPIAGELRSLILVPRIGDNVVSALIVGGAGVPLPLTYHEDEWLKDSGYQLLDDVYKRAWDELVNALIEIQGIEKMGFGSVDRPAIEQTALHKARETLAQKHKFLHDTFQDKSLDIISFLDGFIEDVKSGEIPLAEEMHYSLQGFESEVMDFVGSGVLQFLSYDLLIAEGEDTL